MESCDLNIAFDLEFEVELKLQSEEVTGPALCGLTNVRLEFSNNLLISLLLGKIAVINDQIVSEEPLQAIF